MDYAWFLFSFEGRINRARYWLALLIILCWMIFLGALIVAIGSIFGGPTSFSFGVNDIFRVVGPATYRSPSSTGLVPVFIKAIGTALFAWVYLATSVKRLHDRDKSGWWMVPFFAVPGLYGEFADRLDYAYVALPFALIAFVLCIWGFVEMYCLKGSRKTNRFGPNPLMPVDTRPRWQQHSEVELVPHKAGPPPVWRVMRGHD
jgi:uncharacterized membrane protein YhaH (DUF805 family)